MTTTKQETLSQIARRVGTDKRKHGYTRIYAELFRHLRELPITLLEIGVKEGRSMRLWSEYFVDATIFGVDINPRCKEYASESVTILIGDASDSNWMASIATSLPTMNIIVDDGGHKKREQLTAFDCLFPLLCPGGYYFIEDLHTVHMAGVVDHDTCIPYFNTLAKSLHGPTPSRRFGIESISWYRKLLAVKSK